MIERWLYDNVHCNAARGENANHIHDVVSYVVNVSTFFILYSAGRISSGLVHSNSPNRQRRFDPRGVTKLFLRNIPAYYSARGTSHSPIA
jgi:hypothetical protein